MRSKLLTLATAALLVGLVGGSMTLASAQSEGETLTAIEKELRAKFVDLENPGPSPGDLAVAKNALWNEGETERIGTDWVQCTLNFKEVATCTVGADFFGRGNLTGTGAIDLAAESFTFPITGGTGDFQKVRGEVHVSIIDETMHVEFHLFGTTA
jgi:hypothetical protein